MNTRAAIASAGVLTAVAGLTAGTLASPAHADEGLPPPPPPLHRVVYTMTADKPIYAQIFYLDQEPEIFADWSHNPYQYMPNIAADLGPGKSWSYEVGLNKPEEWAMVMANNGPEPGTPGYRCTISVDGNTVVSNASAAGQQGVLCSLREW